MKEHHIYLAKHFVIDPDEPEAYPKLVDAMIKYSEDRGHPMGPFKKPGPPATWDRDRRIWLTAYPSTNRSTSFDCLADELGISPETVRDRFYKIKKKFGETILESSSSFAVLRNRYNK